MGHWTYYEAVDVDINTVLELMRKKLDALPFGEANTAKFDADDRSAKVFEDPTHVGIPTDVAARGLIVWFEGAPYAGVDQMMPPDRLGSTWSMYTWRTDHDYASMYQGLVNAMQSERLPDGRPLPQVSSFHARIAFTNMMHGDSTLTIFFRT